MDNTKFTKGKWYINTESRIVSCVYSENKESLIHISGKNNEEAKANALLISKAPEMLEMLQSLLLDIMEDVYLHDTSIKQWFEHKSKEVEQLIKEATEL